MKQKKQPSQFYSYSLYYQDQFQKEGNIDSYLDQKEHQYHPVLGIGCEGIFNGKIGLQYQPQYKAINNSVFLMKKTQLTEEETHLLLQQYDITEEQCSTYIHDRSDEIFDQMNVFKHLVQPDTYLIVQERRILIQIKKEDDDEQKYSLADINEIINQYFKTIGMNERLEFHRTRVLYNLRQKLNEQLPELVCESKINEDGKRNEELFQIPNFNKVDGTYDWENKINIPDSLLN